MTTSKLTRRSVLAALAAVPCLQGARAQSTELKIGLAFEPSAFDPHFHNTTPNKSLARSVFEPLVFQDESQRLQPGLAKSWKAVEPTVWEFRLRENVRFHDGKPFGADDVIATFARAPNVPRSPSGFGGFIKGKRAEKVDDLTVRIITDAPAPQTPIDLSTFGIIPASVAGASTEDFNSGKAAIGTGPCRHGEFVRGERVVLTRNPDYWGGPMPWERIVMRVLRADPTRVAALLAGDVDIIETIPTADLPRLRSDPLFHVAQATSNRVIYVMMDQWRDDTPFVRAKDGSAIKNPFKDMRVRHALSLAINRPAICARIMEGAAAPAAQFLPTSFFGTSPRLTELPHDPAQARNLLGEAGFPQGFRLTLHGPAGRYANDTKILEAIAQMLTRIGIEASVETMPAANFFSRASTGGANNTPEFSCFLAGWGSAAGEASDPLRNLAASFDAKAGTGSSNRGRYANADVDRMLAEALSTVNDQDRAALLGQTTEKVIAEMGIIPVIYPTNTWAMRKPLTMTGRADEFTLPFGIGRG
jgi:peptide/nickel transport system substrate-binding protein